MSNTYSESMSKLPEYCAVFVTEAGIGGLVHVGTMGYTPFPALRTPESVNAFNQRHKVTEEQVEAMEIGSRFGWDVPGAKL